MRMTFRVPSFSASLLERMAQGKATDVYKRQDGSCDLYGKIITFMRTIEYTAQGNVNSNQLHLELQSKQNHFALNGTGRPLREENTQ